MADEESGGMAAAEAWRAFVAGLAEAGERLGRSTANLSRDEQADGFRALLRALHNQLARFEVDRERPELVPFNGWRQKLFMDNPDFQYWVADVRPDRRYRVHGRRGCDGRTAGGPVAGRAMRTVSRHRRQRSRLRRAGG